METNFLRALPLVLKHEGGFSNHKDDPGGATNKGITLENYRRYVKRGGTIADLKNITAAEVQKVYNLFYWKAVSADELPSGVDYAVFDFGVNSGPGRAIRFLQKIAGVAQDGVVGPVTLAAVRALAPETIINRLCDDRMAFLKGLRHWPTFGKGWSRRVEDVRKHALAMARDHPTHSETAPVFPEREPDRGLPGPDAAAPYVPPLSRRGSTGGAIAAILIAVASAAAVFWQNIIFLFGG